MFWAAFHNFMSYFYYLVHKTKFLCDFFFNLFFFFFVIILFRSILLNFETFGHFLIIFLWISNLISLWLENILWFLSFGICWDLTLWPRMLSALVNIQCGLESKEYSLIIGHSTYICHLRQVCSFSLCKSFIYSLFLSTCSVNYQSMLIISHNDCWFLSFYFFLLCIS